MNRSEVGGTMADRTARWGIKGKWYPAIAVTITAILCIGSAWFFLKWLAPHASVQTVSLEPLTEPQPDVATLPAAIPSVAPSPLSTSSSSTKLPVRTATDSVSDIQSDNTPGNTPGNTSLPAPTTTAKTTPSSRSVSSTLARQGILRISNATDYPLRVALLAKLPGKQPTATGGDSGYDAPAHWDFSPQEGGNKGLIVSLPDRTLKVRPGDILIAFAQDGSRRYWGPYVIGETPIPAWNPKATEWQLTLQP